MELVVGTITKPAFYSTGRCVDTRHGKSMLRLQPIHIEFLLAIVASVALGILLNNTWNIQPIGVGTSTGSTWWLAKPSPTVPPSFLGIPVTYRVGKPPVSSVHCIGGLFDPTQQDQAWLYRSCEFKNFCYDQHQRDFVLVVSREEQELARMIHEEQQRHDFARTVTLSTVASLQAPISLGAVDLPDPLQDNSSFNQTQTILRKKYAWFPRIIPADQIQDTVGYYQLPDTYVMIPFQESHPLSKQTILEKDFLSIFVLVWTFGWEDRSLLLIRHGTVSDPHWPNRCTTELSSSSSSSSPLSCLDTLRQQLPFMGMHQSTQAFPGSFPTVYHGPIGSSSSTSLLRSTRFVCARNGAAGLGFLFAGGNHPQRNRDGQWVYTHTVGREPTIQAYREFQKRNLLQQKQGK